MIYFDEYDPKILRFSILFRVSGLHFKPKETHTLGRAT
jgi:hypothetical protein